VFEMSGQRCPQCGGYSWNNEGICQNCGYMSGKITPNISIENVDVFKMAEAIRNRDNDNKLNEWEITIPRMSFCPVCNEYTLHYNKLKDYFECLNISKPCRIYFKPIICGTDEYNNIIKKFKPIR
jgi:ribosomal protein L32